MKKVSCLLALLSALTVSSAMAQDLSLQVSKSAPYHDEDIIASNIVTECHQLGTRFSQATARHLLKKGIAASLVDDKQMTDSNESLKLEIANALSGGNAFVGHRKSVSITAMLYKDGELVKKFQTTRDSGGGFMGGFKGSCAVLERCAEALGKDVAGWVARVKK